MYSILSIIVIAMPLVGPLLVNKVFLFFFLYRIEMLVYLSIFLWMGTKMYVYAMELRKIVCLFSFDYVSIAIVYSPLAEVKNEYTTNEKGIYILPKIESVLMNICNQVFTADKK